MTDIDKLFEEVDFNFAKRQISSAIPVNAACGPKIFPTNPPPFNLVLSKIKQELAKGSEVEVRYGFFVGRKFIAGVPKEAFYNLLQVLQKTGEAVVTNTTDYIIENVRIVDQNGKKYVEKKTRLDYRDLEAWGLRISAATEEKLGEMEADKYDISSASIRRKMRYSFPMKTRRWDLTIVTDPNALDKDAIFEVEIEYFQDALNDKLGFEARVEKDFKDGLCHLYKTSKENIMSAVNLKILLANYNNLFDCNKKNIMDRFNDLENKPQSFDLKNVFTGNKYYITPKLDGLRRRLFVDVNGIFIVSPGTRYVEQIAGPYAPTPELAVVDTVLDTEYYKGKYYPFDVLFCNGVSYLNSSFTDRISKSRVVNLDIFNFDKPFFSTSFFDDYKKCLEWQSENPDLNFDGQIAQADMPPYKSLMTMKIKPLEEITVDLLTEINKGVVTLKSYDKNGLKIEKFGDGPIKWKEIKGDGESKPGTGFIAEYNLLAEHPWLKFKGYRNDKIKPNFSNVVTSVKHSFYKDPITQEDLLGETLTTWRKWASLNKRNEISEYIYPGSIILDIGVGRGGTLLAAAKAGAKVFGIDPSKKNLKDLWDRINKSIEEGEGWTDELKENVMTMVAKGQDTKEIVKFVGNSADAIISMFSLSFFYESEKELDALIETIDMTLGNDGVVLFNFMDGERVGKLLLKDGKIDNDLYSIKLGHKGQKDPAVAKFKESEKMGFGIPISITLKQEPDPIFKYQEEWLANFDLLASKMKDSGFKIVKDKFLDDTILPESNTEFARLNRTVVFKRGGIIRNRVLYKADKEDDVVEIGQLAVGKSERWGDYVRHGVEWDDSSFIASATFGMGLDVGDVRGKMHELMDSKLYAKLKDGNVKKRIAFDKLYTIDKAKFIDTDKQAFKASFKEYQNRLLSGPVGHESALLLTMLYPIQIVVLDGSRIVETIGKGETKYVLKISNYAYSPLTTEFQSVRSSSRTDSPLTTEFQSARSSSRVDKKL